MSSSDKKRDDQSLTEAYEITEVSCRGFYEEKGNILCSLLEGKKILEAGCGTGSLFKYLIDKKFDVTGVDYSKTLLDIAREKNLPVKLFSADLRKKETWKQFESSFDSAISSEVIEHLEDDVLALEIIYYVLKPNGVIVVDTPAFNFLYSGNDKRIGHFRRYTKKSLKEILEKAGFKVEKIRYWNFIGFFGWLFYFKLLKKYYSFLDKKTWMGNFLGKFLKIESKITFPLGLTVLAKARKLEKK